MDEETFKLTSFTQEDYDKYVADFEHDKNLEKEADGAEISKDEYVLALNPAVLNPVAFVDVKGLDYEDKKRFVKFCLGCEAINNACIISNLVTVAQGRLIDEELYEREDIFFVDDIEYLDMCTDLREEILEFNTKLVAYFLGAFKSMASLIGDGAEHIPNEYFIALSSYSLNTMSSAMQKVSIDYDNLPKVLNAEVVVEKVCEAKNFASEFIGELLKKITEDAEVEEVN